MNNALLQRFLEYVAIETTSDENSESQPSTSCQLNLLKKLKDELTELGVKAVLDDFGYVMASIPSNCEESIPTIGFIAHVDTSPDASHLFTKWFAEPSLRSLMTAGNILLRRRSQETWNIRIVI